MRQRILFLVPPVRLNRHEYEYLVHWPRHALAIAAELGNEYDIQILDVTAEFHSDARWGTRSFREVMVTLIEERVQAFAPTIVAVHAHAAPHVPIAIDCLKTLQRCTGSFITVVGGMAASHLPAVLSPHVPPRGWIVRGEASGRARQLFDIVAGAASPPSDIVVVSNDRGVRVLTLGEPVLDVDYPLPPFDLLPMAVYKALFRSGDFVPHLETSLGCRHHCTFCGVHYPRARGGYRRRSANRVIEELRFLRERYGFDEFYFCDETFTMDPEQAAVLCAAIAEDLPGIRWRCVTRVDALDPEMVTAMARAGCYEIGFGIEAGSDTTLKKLAKGASTDRAVRTIQLVQQAGIAANALLIIGLPHEDHCDIRRTFEYIATVARPQLCQIFVFHPVPGTIYFEQPGRFGLTLPALDKLENWYLFDHIGDPVCDTRLLSRADIARYYLLFNEAFATIADLEADSKLIERILSNRFPVRRKGVTWLRDAHVLRIYRPTDPSASIAQSCLVVEPDDLGGDSVKRLEAISLLLSLADGSHTRTELEGVIASGVGIEIAIAAEWTEAYITMLDEAGVLTEF